MGEMEVLTYNRKVFEMTESVVMKFYTLDDANAFLALCRSVLDAGVKVDVHLERIPMIGSQDFIYRMDCSVDVKDGEVVEPEVENVGG